MTENFADTYFSCEDCTKIGFIREDVEQNYQKGKINDRERALLITSLLYAMDKIARPAAIMTLIEKERSLISR